MEKIEKNIKNKKNNNFMQSKILILFVMIGLLFGSSFAINSWDSTNNEKEIEEVFGDTSYLKVNSFVNLVFTNTTYDLERGKNYHLESNNLLNYVISNNNDYEQEFVFVTIYKEDGTTYAKGNFINISGLSSEMVVIQPTADYEYISTEVYCKSDDSSCGAGYQIKETLLVEEKQGVNSAFTPLISGVVDLITINVTIWKAVFYLFIFSIVAVLIVGIFRGAFWLMEKSKDLNNKDGMISQSTNHRHDEENK